MKSRKENITLSISIVYRVKSYELDILLRKFPIIQFNQFLEVSLFFLFFKKEGGLHRIQQWKFYFKISLK